jgi:uncharacterized protein YqhQ
VLLVKYRKGNRKMASHNAPWPQNSLKRKKNLRERMKILINDLYESRFVFATLMTAFSPIFVLGLMAWFQLAGSVSIFLYGIVRVIVAAVVYVILLLGFTKVIFKLTDWHDDMMKQKYGGN